MTYPVHPSGEPVAEEIDEDYARAEAEFAEGPLRFLKPQETKRLIKARGPRPFINLFRFGLPFGALILLIALILWPAINPNKIVATALKTVPDFVIKNLHFTGLDSKNQPYSITALKATRPGGTANIYDLDNPEGEMTLTSGAWLSGKAKYGRLDNDKRKLWLGGDVQLFHDKGYQFTTDEAQIDIDNYYAWGERPVLIQGDFGEIRGHGFRLLDSGNIMVVGGPAKAILNLHTADSSPKPRAASK